MDSEEEEEDTISTVDSSAAPSSPLDQIIGEARNKETETKKNRHTYDHRRDIEDLQARQYWREGWRTDAPLGREFSLGDASTLGMPAR